MNKLLFVASSAAVVALMCATVFAGEVYLERRTTAGGQVRYVEADPQPVMADPAPPTYYIRRANGTVVAADPQPVKIATEVPTPDPEPDPVPEAPPVSNWVKCADEFTWCAFIGNKTVRYGAGNTWVYKSFQNGAQCQNSTMAGYDPLPGIPKACYIGGDAPAPQPELEPEVPPVDPGPENPAPVDPPPHHGHNPNDGTGFMPAVDASKNMTPAQGFTTLRLRSTSQQPVGSPHDNGAFRIWCTPSHMNNDDAILYPGQQGRAHHHTYYGNTSANYASTTESLLAANSTTCNGGTMNKSAYWLPSVIDTEDGTPIAPRNVLLYYKHGPVQPFPKGLKIIAGNMNRDTPMASWEAYSHFECNEQYASRQNHLVNCGRGGLLSMSVTFPDCWDGKNLQAVGQTHMRYSSQGQCPSSHPVRVPTLTVIAYYHVTKNSGTSNWRLSSDNYDRSKPAGYSAHADFMWAWDEALHKVLVDNCINKRLDCHAHLTGDGREFY